MVLVEHEPHVAPLVRRMAAAVGEHRVTIVENTTRAASDRSCEMVCRAKLECSAVAVETMVIMRERVDGGEEDGFVRDGRAVVFSPEGVVELGRRQDRRGGHNP